MQDHSMRGSDARGEPSQQVYYTPAVYRQINKIFMCVYYVPVAYQPMKQIKQKSQVLITSERPSNEKTL